MESFSYNGEGGMKCFVVIPCNGAQILILVWPTLAIMEENMRELLSLLQEHFLHAVKICPVHFQCVYYLNRGPYF